MESLNHLTGVTEMSRNLRNSNHPAPNPVDSYPVAPDRYNDPNTIYPDNSPLNEGGMRLRDWTAAQPYQPGDVVWLDYCGETRKAYISAVFNDYDRYGDRRAKYRVHMANKKGDQFAKNWFYTWPGFIERGYQIAAKNNAIDAK